MAQVPFDRLLVESDAPDQFPKFSDFSRYWKDQGVFGSEENDVVHTGDYPPSKLLETVKQLSSESLIAIMNDGLSNNEEPKIENEPSLIPFVIETIYQHLKRFNSGQDFQLSLNDLQQIIFKNGKTIYKFN